MYAYYALMVDPGKSWKNSVWRWYEESRLDCCVSLDLVKKQGITLDNLHACQNAMVAI